VIDFTFSISANWQKLRRSLCVPLLYTYISFKSDKNDSQGGSQVGTRAEVFQRGHLTWRAVASSLISVAVLYILAVVPASRNGHSLSVEPSSHAVHGFPFLSHKPLARSMKST